MTSIIDPAIDTTARDTAIKIVEGACPAVVNHEIRAAAELTCRTMQKFTADDIVAIATLTPPEPRVLGAIMLWAQKQGYCVPTGVYRQSRSRKCHNRPKMVWRSLIFRGTHS